MVHGHAIFPNTAKKMSIQAKGIEHRIRYASSPYKNHRRDFREFPRESNLAATPYGATAGAKRGTRSRDFPARLPFHRSGHRYAFALAAVLLLVTGCEPREPRNADECFASGGVVWSENNEGMPNGCLKGFPVVPIPADMDSSIIPRTPAETTSSAVYSDTSDLPIGGSAGPR